MKRKTYSLRAVIVLALICLWYEPQGIAAVVPVPYHSQEQTQWCWAGVSQMVLEYFGTTQTQTEIATYGIQNAVNNWNYLTGFYAATTTEPWRRGIDQILSHFGNINTTLYNQALTTAQLDTEFTGSRPVIARLGWFDTAGHPAGGHFVVVKGNTGGIISVNDPWPDNGILALEYNSLVGDGATAHVYTAASSAHKWTHSLAVAGSADIVFLIDSTGSMSDDIDAVKSAANSLLTNLTSKFKDYRIAVVDYRDNPDDIHGELSDWITNVRTGFTTDVPTAQNAINAIVAGGGLDTPEAVYSALLRSISGSDPGVWRDKPVKRVIIIMGDAPGHYPAEPWIGGVSQDEVISSARTNEVLIQALLVAGGTEAGIDFSTIATASGGALYNASGASDVAAIIEQIVDDAAANKRSPQGEIAEFTPTFSFILNGVGMASSPKKSFLEIQKCAIKNGVCDVANNTGWKLYKRVAVTGKESWTPTAPLPKAQFRWRLANLYGASKILSPSGEVLNKAKAGTRYEDPEGFTEFVRVDVPPGTPEIISPSNFFTPTEASVTYQWKKASNASKYKLVIFKDNKPWKTKVVKPPKKDPGAPILEITIGGHKTSSSYFWSVTGLNFDHPK